MIFEPKKRKSTTASTYSSSICCEVMGLDGMILVFFNVVLRQLFHAGLDEAQAGIKISVRIINNLR